MEKVFITKNFEKTQELGKKFVLRSKILLRRTKKPIIICLYGDLGSGKTTFTQGLAKGLEIKNRIISPSFIIVRKYRLSDKNFYHIDLYRLESNTDIESLGLEEIFDDKNSIVVIEWAEKLGSQLPKERIDIYFENIEDDKRKIKFQGHADSLVPSDVLASRPGSPLRALDGTPSGHVTPLRKAIEVFKKGGVVVFPTDTAYGIGCRIDDEIAVKKVFDLKKRDYNKPLLALVGSQEMANKYISIPEDVRHKLLDKYWPGGLTVFLKCDLEKVSSIVRSGTDSLAIRLPGNEDIRDVINQVGVPIIATSANISGEPTPYYISEVDKELISKADFVLEGECTFKKQSTIIDCTQTPWKIIREGAVKVEL